MKDNNNTHTKRYSSEISTEPTLHCKITQVRFNSSVKPPGRRFSHAHIRSERKSSRSLEPEFWRVQLSSRSSFIINACPDGATQRDTQTAKHPHTLVQTVWSHHSLSGRWWEKLQRSSNMGIQPWISLHSTKFSSSRQAAENSLHSDFG